MKFPSQRAALTACVALLASAFLVVALAYAHPGGHDGYGGHNDRKHGGYHFHSGPLAGRSFGSKNEAIAALEAARKAAQAPQPTVQQPKAVSETKATSSANCDCDALARLLIAKGVITEAELAAAWMGK